VGTFCIVPVLSRGEFDAIEFEAAFSGDHEAAAQRMSRLAVTGTQTASMPRAEAFLRAGEQWLLADDPAAAASGFRLALADGGPVFVDPRVPLARALFLLGKSAEARALISKLKAEGRHDPRMCDLVAELLVERSDLPGALDWATAGVELCLQREAGRARRSGLRLADADQGDDDRAELRMLLSLRYRIRNDLGMAEDDYDKLLDEAPSGEEGEDATSVRDRAARTVSESDASSRSTSTSSPSPMSPDNRPRAS
jgi:tetratricopeptide (TPR) repeat protein